ncbi:outer membrane lipid asymmetry maintenance protein MlaD [Paracoccus sp. SMMA_5_TC]|nr:outer membrane lipid asymmetry maintenance protein MlaD [Paracoccus sp. SMMA_5]UXU80592.1 outer membrane lipid asymmetry maintenance protein MlaD [Paracoccus sp. SMMA_5_TC]
MQSRAERAEFWVGALVLAIAALFLFWSTKGTTMSARLGSGYELRAAFPSVDGIEIGTEVRVAGVRIGKVTGIELDPQTYLAEARMALPAALQLPVDSAALIQSDGLLGGAYIELQPGGADELLQPGDEIEDVQGAVSLLTLMMKFVDAQSSRDGNP